MSISLQGVSKWQRTGKGLKRIFGDLNIEVGEGDRTALLGTTGTGKSLVLALMTGEVEPDRGLVQRQGRVSWKLPSAPSVLRTLTGATNARFLARLYDMDGDLYLERIKELTNAGDLLNIAYGYWPKLQRQQFTVALGLCLDFDTFLFDDAVVLGSKDFRSRCEAILSSLDEDKSILFATKDLRSVKRFCSQAYVLHEERALFFPEIDEAIAFFKTLGGTPTETVEEQEPEIEEIDDEEDRAIF
jgi:capsular polysaccharide transport system ATP-binding protein